MVEFPFRIGDPFDDMQTENEKALFIDFVFYGVYQGKQMNFNVTFQYYNEDNYFEMIDYLKRYENKTLITVKINVKKIQDFRVDVKELAEKLLNPEICKFERNGWGAYDEEELLKLKEKSKKR